MTKRKDAYPSYKSSPDRGCEFAPSCLNCPLPRCIEDEHHGRIARAEKRNRDEEIIQQWKQGKSVSGLAKAFDVSENTIRRAVKK